MRRLVVPALLSLGLALPGCLPAQADVERGREALRSGRYEEAVRALEPATTAGALAERVRAARLLAEAHAATGDHERALAALDRVERDAPSGSRDAVAAELAGVRGRMLRIAARHEEAGSAFDRAVAAGASDALAARLARAELLWDRGERDRAFAEFDTFIDAYNDGSATDAEAIAAVAAAAAYLGRRDPALFHDAVRAYGEAIAADPTAPGPRIGLGELFLAKFDGSEAQALLGEVLARNPRDADALVAMARAKRFEGSDEAVALVDRALAVNPRHVPARSFRALLLLEQGDGDGAVAEADRALELDAAAARALAVRAAAHLFADDAAAFEADRRRALARDPTGGGFDATVAELAVRRARYSQAVELAQRAVELDPLAWEAWAVLGMNQLRIGEVEAARRTLERAFAGDPFNVWTKNTLDLMDRMAGFTVVRTDRFELVLDPGEAELLEPYIAEVAEQAYAVLSERYGYRPATPVRVEVYPQHADFSVRTMGLPGLGALGVAFGNVLALNSPAARDVGAFHWGSTLWHEIAHAVTLGLTRHRVPRWLTEGISVREERRSRPGWGGGPSLDFLMALHRDMLLPMDRIDEGFVRPEYPGQVAVSYQHASWIVDLIEREHGDAAVRRMLEAYRRGADTEAVFRDVLGTDLRSFDAAFDRDARDRFGPALAAVAGLDRGDGADGPTRAGAPGLAARADRATMVQRARARPDHFGLQLAAGTALFEEGRGPEAIPFLERAKALFPEYVVPGSPAELMARIHRGAGNLDGTVAELAWLAVRDETALAANLELAGLLEERGQRAEAAAALERAIFIHPYDPSAHERLADLAAELGQSDREIRERKAVLALGPTDRAGALYRLALAYRRADDTAAARRSVLEALEIAPDFADAQDLLLELSEDR